MSENFVDYTGLSYFKGRLDVTYASKTEVNSLDGRVDALEAAGGEPNAIESISVNGTAVTPDQNKNVALTVPTATSALVNDGDGQSNYATESYVDSHGSAIEHIKVNGTEQTISNKTVSLTVPTATSELINDGNGASGSKFATNTDLTGLAFAVYGEIDKVIAKVSGVYRYKGSVATQSSLPASGNESGDVYDVQDTGTNFAWNGSAWDALGQIIDTSNLWTKTDLVAITTAQIDALFA